MANKPSDPKYWEDWARGLGWDATQVQRAGEVGSLAVARGMTPKQASGVVLARVRDGKHVRIGPGAFSRVVRHPGARSFALGLLAFLSAGVDVTSGLAVGLAFPVFFGFVVVLQLFASIEAFSKGARRTPMLGIAMTTAAVAVLIVPSYRRH